MSVETFPVHDDPRPKPPCTCGPWKTPTRTCRCTCDKCYSKRLLWESWGSYLDKDLVCQECGHVQDIWDC